jgi:hypothetical protein
MLFRTGLLSIAVSFTLPVLARPKIDVIVMKNGDRFTCEIKKLEKGVLYGSFDYIDGTVSLDWSKVARVESTQLFAVQTSGGLVYTGSLKTPATPADEPVKIDVVEPDNKEVPLVRSEVVDMQQTAQTFWKNFSGSLGSGLIYSRGNNTTQYNLTSDLAYRRPRWAVTANYSSSLSASSGAATSTRNQEYFQGLKLLQRSNWFVTGLASFLQSSQQGIQLQSSVGGGFGRFLTNTNRSQIAVMGGVAWQGTTYTGNYATLGQQNLAAGMAGASVQVFKFKVTTLNLTATVFPALTQPGRVQTNINSAYKIQIINNLWWNFTFYGNWDNRPPTGLSGSDYGASSGITYSFP